MALYTFGSDANINETIVSGGSTLQTNGFVSGTTINSADVNTYFKWFSNQLKGLADSLGITTLSMTSLDSDWSSSFKSGLRSYIEQTNFSNITSEILYSDNIYPTMNEFTIGTTDREQESLTIRMENIMLCPKDEGYKINVTCDSKVELFTFSVNDLLKVSFDVDEGFIDITGNLRVSGQMIILGSIGRALHAITIYYPIASFSTPTSNTCSGRIVMVTSQTTSYTYSTLRSWLYENGFTNAMRAYPASGSIQDVSSGTNWLAVEGIYATSSAIVICLIDKTTLNTNSTIYGVNDIVINI